MLTYFTVPSTTEMLSTASETFNPLFTEFLPWALIALAVGACVLILRWIGSAGGKV